MGLSGVGRAGGDLPVAPMIDLLAENNFGDTRSGSLAGPTGFLVILFLVVGTILLIRSMNKHLRRVPERFEPPSAPLSSAPVSPAPVSPALPPTAPGAPRDIQPGQPESPHDPA